jgi:hypothetical protein
MGFEVFESTGQTNKKTTQINPSGKGFEIFGSPSVTSKPQIQPEQETATVSTPQSPVSSVKNIVGVPIGMDILPVNKDDSGLKKVGKGLVNYGLGTAARLVNAPFELPANIINTLTAPGKEKEYITSPTQIFPKSGQKKFEQFSQKHPVIGGIAENVLYDIANPLTYVTGGIASDLARAKNLARPTGQLLPPVKAPAGYKGEIPKRETTAPKPTDFYADPFGNVQTRNQYGQLLLPEGKNTYASQIKEIDNEIAAVKKQMEEMMEGASSLIPKQEDDLQKIIRVRGGIAPSRTGAFSGEYAESVPSTLKNKNGIPIDEMADELGIDVRTLIDKVSDTKTRQVEYDDLLKQAQQFIEQSDDYQSMQNFIDSLEGVKAEITPLVQEAPSGPPLDFRKTVIAKPGGKFDPLFAPRAGEKMPSNTNTLDGGAKPSMGANLKAGGLAADSALPDTRYQGKAPDIDVKDAQSAGIIAGKISPRSKEGKFGFWDRFYNAWIDRKHPINRVAQETGNENLTNIATNIEGAGGTTHYILNQGLVNRAGKEIGESYANIIKDIKPEKFVDFEDYLKHQHNIDRAAEGKKIFADVDGIEITPDISMRKVAEYEAKHPEFKQTADRVYKFWDDFMREWAVNGGLITKDLYNQLRAKYPRYIPTYRVFSELEKVPQKGVKKKFVNVPSPIKKATGSDREVISPIEMMMSLVDKTVRSSRYNEVGQSLLESIRANPNKAKPWAEIVEDPGIKDDLLKEINESLQNNGIEGMMVKIGEQFDEAFAKTNRKGRNIVRVMENGKPVMVKVNNKHLLDALTGLTKSEMGEFEKVARTITGFMKNLITVYNPIFGVKNLARDLPTGYVYGSEKNPAKYTGQAGKGAVDILKNDPLYKQYKALGGGMGNIASEGLTLRGLDMNKSKAGKALDKLNKFNNTIEDMQRFAQFKRTLQENPSSYKNLQKALTDSMEVTTNFSRGGRLAKKVDSSVLYFNAGVQGLDKLARQVYRKPLETLIKGGIGVTAPTLFLDYINQNDPNYQKLDNRTKDNYFLFPKGDGTFFKLPKSRELGVLFGSLAERTLRKIRGDDKAFKGYGQTAAVNFAPANPVENNIAAPLVYNIPSNRDFANRPIVPQYMLDGRSPRLQYDEKTSEIAKKIGDIANLSPKQVDYIIKSYTGIIGQIMLPANTKGQDKFKTIKYSFVADPLYSNQDITDFYDNYNKLKRMAADKNIKYDIPSDAVTMEESAKNAFAKASKAISDLKKIQNKIQVSDISPEEKEKRTREIQSLVVKIASSMNQRLK